MPPLDDILFELSFVISGYTVTVVKVEGIVIESFWTSETETWFPKLI